MRLSTRNQLPGTIASITTGEAMAIVRIKLDGSEQVITSAITKDACEDLGLEVGSKVVALVKSTEVQIGIEG